MLRQKDTGNRHPFRLFPIIPRTFLKSARTVRVVEDVARDEADSPIEVRTARAEITAATKAGTTTANPMDSIM